MSGPCEVFSHNSGIPGGGQCGAVAGDFCFGDASAVRVDGGGEDLGVLEREARAFGEDFPALGDEKLAVEDDASGFVAEEIGVEVGDAKGA